MFNLQKITDIFCRLNDFSPAPKLLVFSCQFENVIYLFFFLFNSKLIIDELVFPFLLFIAYHRGYFLTHWNPNVTHEIIIIITISQLFKIKVEL